MRLPALFRRLAVPAAIGILALAGTALPAQADQLDMPLVGFFGPETVTVITGQSKTVKLELINVGGPAEDVVLQFGDAKQPLSPDLGFAAPAGCRGTTCQLGDLRTGERKVVRFTVKPSIPAGSSPVLVLPVATVIGGRTNYAADIAVVRTAKGGVDLEMGDIKDLQLARGKSAEVPVVVRNTGNQDVQAVGLVVLPLYGGAVQPALNYRNCERETELGGLICVINEPVTGGGTFTLPAETPLTLKAAPDASGPFDYPIMVGVVGLSQKYVFDFAARTAGAKGAVLKLEAAATASAGEPEPVEDLNEDDNYATLLVSLPKSAADSAAVGGVFRGAIGDTRTATAGVRNLGPTGVVPPSIDNLPYAHVRIPTGIELLEVDGRCIAGTSPDDLTEDAMFSPDLRGRDFVCLVFDLPKGEKGLFSFTGEILAGEHRAGKVTVHGGVQDTRRGNDTAAFTVELTGGGAGGGLPITGAPAGLVAVGGALLVVVGAVAYRTGRRRRILTAVD